MHVLITPEGLQGDAAAAWRTEAMAGFSRSDTVLLVEFVEPEAQADDGKAA